MNHFIVGAIAVLALVVGSFGLLKEPTPSKVVEIPAGSASSPSIIDGCMELGAGGPTLCTYRVAMTNASSTCSFKTVMASSTLIRAVARTTNVQGGTFDLEFGKAVTAFATTTSLGYAASVAAGTTVTASSSPANVDNGANAPYNFSAGNYLNVKIGTTTVSSGLRGTCTALFLSI